MTEAYVYREDWNCVLLRSDGERDIEDHHRLVTALKADARIRPHYLRLTDVRAVDPLPSAEFTRGIALVMSELEGAKPAERVAILVSEDIQFGMIRLYQAHLGDSQDKVRVFRSLAEAYDWLGLPPDTPDPFAPELWAPDWRSDAA